MQALAEMPDQGTGGLMPSVPIKACPAQLICTDTYSVTQRVNITKSSSSNFEADPEAVVITNIHKLQVPVHSV